MSIPIVLSRIASSRECKLNPEVSENWYFIVYQWPAIYDVASCSYIMWSAVARAMGLFHATVGCNVQREEQHPKIHIGFTVGPTFSILGCVSSVLFGIDTHRASSCKNKLYCHFLGKFSTVYKKLSIDRFETFNGNLFWQSSESTQ